MVPPSPPLVREWLAIQLLYVTLVSNFASRTFHIRLTSQVRPGQALVL